ncbi:MAG: bifunctional 4-hydroxy-2-oxoglutarate aldolase/2-dehydro-3-deoxy-phosphogluconate aldolase [Propionicimonas sp.]
MNNAVPGLGHPVADLIRAHRVVAIVRGLTTEQTLRTTAALAEAGIVVLEVTFAAETPAAVAENAATISRLLAEFGDRLTIGAGTVTTLSQLAAAESAGARFVVSPNTDPAIIAAARERGLAVLPGALTPSEAIAARRAGAHLVKLFPAEQLGPGYLKALRGPLPQIPFVAVGGIRADNARAFLDAGAVGLGVGGRMVSRALADAGQYDQMAAAARALLTSIDERRDA